MTILHNNGKDEIQAALDAVAGEQRVRLLGPYTVMHNTPNIESQANLVELSADLLVIAAWAEIISPFDGNTMIGISLDGAAFNAFYAHADSELDGISAVPQSDNLGNFVNSYTRPFKVRNTTQLYTWIDGGPLTQGEADVYAIIAEPVE